MTPREAAPITKAGLAAGYSTVGGGEKLSGVKIPSHFQMIIVI